ncbi:MAG: HAMP domain-containing sensor histidine kinase [Saezia sp.]
MYKNRSFTKLFSFYFIVIMAIMTVVFIVVGIGITNRFFAYYTDKMHEESQQMLAMKVASHYMMYKTWDGIDTEQLAQEGQKTGNYFTLTTMEGRELFSNEREGSLNLTHDPAYLSRVLPIMMGDQQVGSLRTGYFAADAMSAEAYTFKSSGIFLIVFSIACISLVAVLVSILFFYRLSKPISTIARSAKSVAGGHWQSKVEIESNVSEVHEIADAINLLAQSLLNQEKFRQQLIVELSHELRTPLQILLNQIEAMLDGIYDADQARLESMHSEITRVGELLNELEDRLIYENSNFDLNIALAEVSQIVRKIAIGYEGGFAQKGLDFSYAIEPGLFAQIDSIRFAQVVINILSNALKYTASGQVSLSLKRVGLDIEISVSDTGEGIDEDTIVNIANRTEHDFKSVNSKGVGLYIAKLIVDKHGWKMEIDSRKNQGTRITILIRQPKVA